MKVISPEDAEIVVQKLPSDIGIHRNPRKGTLNAPENVLEDYSFNRDVLVDEVFPDEFSLENTHRRIENSTEDLLKYDKPLISIGGDHSVSYPVISSLKRHIPNLKLVWLDSHLDLKEKVGSHVSHDVVVRELLRHGFSEEEIYFVGITRIDHDEEEFIDDRNFNIYRATETEDFLREFKNIEQPVYLSVDIDVLSDELAPGTGYPDGELDLETVKEIIREVSPYHADIVEVAPSLDKKGKTVESAKEILEEITKSLNSNQAK